jgi:hypothetical protein
MITKTIEYWNLTQLVKERIAEQPVRDFVMKYFGTDWNHNIFKSKKDEVLQIYNDDICFTCIGGSSKDEAEWKSNFRFADLKNIFKKAKILIQGLIHVGYWNGSNEVYNHPSFIKRSEMYYGCHSRGAGIASVIVYRFGGTAVGFGTPKAFLKKVFFRSGRFINVRNPFDPVVHLVPFFATVGEVRKIRFAKNPHTKYGKHINKEELI